MPTRRAHIVFPEDLIREIDELVGPRGRTAFLLDTARKEIQRQKLLRFLDRAAPAWNDKDHPELAGGSGTWVRKMRHENEHRTRAGRDPSAK
ncbi:MAG TPA: hypothetical protein VFA68_14690 [Terriglobales bacterium]|nr:hypothetical protein [Terriglobales bacterium]